MIKRTNKKNSNHKTISEMIKRRRVFKEQEDRKEINTMQDLVDYLQNDYHLVYDTSLDDLQELGFDFWNDAIDTGGRCVLKIDAHVDDRDKVWFGITDFKVGYFDDMDYNEWAKSILKWNNISEKDILSEDDINEMVGNAVDDMLRNDDIYVDYFSKDISLPCDKKDIDNVIRENKERIEDNIYRAEKRLFDEIESICQEKGIIVESKRTGKRKPLKETSVQSFTDWEYPVLKDVMSTFKDDIQWALSRALYSMKSNLPRLESDNESEVLRALADILDKADDMNKVKKALKRTSLGQRMW